MTEQLPPKVGATSSAIGGGLGSTSNAYPITGQSGATSSTACPASTASFDAGVGSAATGVTGNGASTAAAATTSNVLGTGNTTTTGTYGTSAMGGYGSSYGGGMYGSSYGGMGYGSRYGMGGMGYGGMGMNRYGMNGQNGQSAFFSPDSDSMGKFNEILTFNGLLLDRIGEWSIDIYQRLKHILIWLFKLRDDLKRINDKSLSEKERRELRMMIIKKMIAMGSLATFFLMWCMRSLQRRRAKQRLAQWNRLFPSIPSQSAL